MSTSPRTARRLLTVLTSVVLGAGLLSAAHADRPDQATVSALATPLQPGLILPLETPATSAPGPSPTPETPAPVEVPDVGAEAAPAVAPAPTPVPPTAPPAPAAPPPPAPAPPGPAPAPAPAPEPEPAPPASDPDPEPEPAESDAERVERAYITAVPADWRGAITPTFEIISGSTSWASSTGRISIASDHLRSFDVLVDVVAHEFGHLIAFRYGSQAYAGAPPAGWPAPSERPEEAWADCVQRVFLGRSNPSHGLPPCDGEQLSAARSWLEQGPGAHARTG